MNPTTSSEQAKMVLLGAIEEPHVLASRGSEAYTLNWISARRNGWSASMTIDMGLSFPVQSVMDSYEAISEEAIEAAAFLGILSDHREAA